MSADARNADRRLDINARIAFADHALEVSQSWTLTGCTAVFGPSGAGKSTLLRLIAGFLKPAEGRIAFAGEVWCDTAHKLFLPPHKRRIGYMFQDGRLFPHLSVAQNLAYADQRSEALRPRYSQSDIVDAFDLTPLLERRPASLSGGERQRAALARTLLTRPDLLLLDEPLSALDQGRKREILPYLEDLPARFGAPTVYVSHNVDEIVRLADRTVLLTQGRIDAVGPTADVLNAYGAADPLAEREAGASGCVLSATILEHDEAYALTKVKTGDSSLTLPLNRQRPVGAQVNIRIDARNVAIALTPPTGLSIRNILPATVSNVTAAPGTPFAEVEMTVGEVLLRAQVTRAALDDLDLKPGRSVYALVKSASFAL